MPHIHVSAEQISKKVIICGDPERVTRASFLLTDTTLIAHNREFKVLNGYYQNELITICSTGIGSPSTGIVIEELNKCNVQKIIRVGSCGSLRHDINHGDIIVAEGAVRDEGTSKSYVADGFPAVASRHLMRKIEDSILSDTQLNHYFGIVRSHDSFYIDNESEILHFWSQKNVIGCDMETSTLLTLARLRGIEAASILFVVTNFSNDVLDEISNYTQNSLNTKFNEQEALKLALETLIK
ncbi:nucleoside phosphorylase [Paraphotobacterium marinum]